MGQLSYIGDWVIGDWVIRYHQSSNPQLNHKIAYHPIAYRIIWESVTPPGSHVRKEDDVPDRLAAREQHDEAIDAHAFAGGGREPVFQRADIVFVHGVRFLVALCLFQQLLL